MADALSMQLQRELEEANGKDKAYLYWNQILRKGIVTFMLNFDPY